MHQKEGYVSSTRSKRRRNGNLPGKVNEVSRIIKRVTMDKNLR